MPVKELLDSSSISCPGETRSRLYVPSVVAETVTRYVSPEPEIEVTGLAVPLLLLPWLMVSVQLFRMPSSAEA